MPYEHGIRIKENPTSLPIPAVSDAGVPVIFGTAPINLASDPASATNKLFLCETFADAQAALGYSDDWESYTLCEAMYAFFRKYAISPVIFCNVLEQTTHKAAYTEASALAVTDGVAKGTVKGVILSTLVVKDGDNTTLVEGTDYTAAFDDNGYPVYTVLKAGVETIAPTGYKLDPSLVTAADIIGSYNSSTGVSTGIEMVREVWPRFAKTPGLLLAPGFSSTPSVGAALQAKCENINGKFQCECVLDLDSATTRVYTAVEAAKNAAGYTSKHSICLWPKVKVDGKIMDYSAIYAAMALTSDYKNGDVPNLSPSNKPLAIDATVLADGTEVVLDQLQGNVLNGAGVVTAINENGFRSWGNNTAAYPDNTDPKDRWICCRRFFSWWGNSFIKTYFEKVDDPTNFRLIESIVDSENVRGNSLKSQGKCAGIRMEYNAGDNPIESIINGHIVFRQYLAPYTPAEDILNILEFDPSMIEAELGG